MPDLTDEEVRGLISEHYGEEIEACRELLEFAIAELQAWSGRPIKRGADRIIVAEASRATKTFDAVIGLCEAGYGEQAAMLNRSLFEGMAVAHWVSDNRREAVGLFTRHAKFSAVLWQETFDALGWLTDAERRKGPSVGPKRRSEFVALFGKYGTQPWVPRSMPKLLRAIEHLWDEEGRAYLWAFYEVPHRHSNQMLHSTATAVGATTTGQTADVLYMTIGPSDQLVTQALFSAFWIYGQLFTLLVDVFRVVSGTTLRELYHSAGEVFSRGVARRSETP